MDNNELVDAMLAQVQARLASPIEDPEELERLRKGLEGVAERAATLRQHPLTNGNEPDFVFRAYRSESE
jgi:hypothetical protein